MIKSKAGKNAAASAGGADGSQASVDGTPGENEEDEESWTFVGGGDEADFDFAYKRSSSQGGASLEHAFLGMLDSSQSSAGSRALGSRVLGAGGSNVGVLRSPGGGGGTVPSLTHGKSSGASRLAS